MLTNSYEEKPFLLLLHCYILDCIGELQDQERRRLASMTPKLQKVFGGNDDWFAIVSRQMQFSDEFPGAVRALWQKNRSIAAAAGINLIPMEFAETFVKKNFPDI